VKTLAEHEAWVKANAEYFTAVVFRGRGRYDRQERSSLELAREAARAMLPTANGRPVGIYAVQGVYEAHVENIT